MKLGALEKILTTETTEKEEREKSNVLKSGVFLLINLCNINLEVYKINQQYQYPEKNMIEPSQHSPFTKADLKHQKALDLETEDEAADDVEAQEKESVEGQPIYATYLDSDFIQLYFSRNAFYQNEPIEVYENEDDNEPRKLSPRKVTYPLRQLYDLVDVDLGIKKKRAHDDDGCVIS